MELFKDVVLAELVKKKKALLNDLLVFSIHSACTASQTDTDIRHRSDLLSMLERNDKAIKIRERQSGIDATAQEQVLYGDIAVLLSSIKDNNLTALSKLETIEKAYETEKSALGMGKKLSSYLVQTKARNRSRPKRQAAKTNTRYGIL